MVSSGIEKGAGFNSEHRFNAEKLAQEAESQREKISDDLERRSEKEKNSPENLEEIRHEALERAKEARKEDKEDRSEKLASIEKASGPISRMDREASFSNTMAEAQSHMSFPEKTFSKFIHNKAIEKTSEVTGKTIARPNAILSGSISAFLLTTIVLLIARHYGYPLSGFESIGAFIIGWIIGVLYDLLRVLVTGKTG